MTLDRSSRTAEFMALFRALESLRRPQDRLFDDDFARGFLGPRFAAVLTVCRVPPLRRAVCAYIDHHWPGARSSAVARTRLIDEALVAALDAGVGQVVILGAGFDCRAYRVRGVERATVLEVDHPATQATKQRRLVARLGKLPAHVRLVGVDLGRDPLGPALAAAGFSAMARTFVIWEGVTHYLTAAAIDATLAWVSTATAPGSRLLFTYVHRGVLDGSVPFHGAERALAAVRDAGEPWTFGLDPADVRAFLARRGLTLIEDLGAAEYRARYLRGRPSRGYEFYRAALVEVRGGATTGRVIA